MGREHEPETVWRAQELYCADRLPMREVAEAVGVAESTCWEWCNRHGWRAKREEIAQAQASIAGNLILARAGMIEALIAGKDAQTGFAVASLERLAMDQAEAARAGRVVEQQLTAERREINTPEDAAAALKEAVEAKLARLLADPSAVDLRAIKDVKEALGLAQQLTPEDKTAVDHRGLTARVEELIREGL